VPVILHGRLGEWFRQLRPRLREQPVRWLESRSFEDLRLLLDGLAAPLVLIDTGREPASALKALGLVTLTVPGARILVLAPAMVEGYPVLSRELGATHLFSGFVPPPAVANLLARWIVLARRDMEQSGWSRTTFPETETDPWSWFSDYLDESGQPAVQMGYPVAGRRLARCSDPIDSFSGHESAPRLPGSHSNEG
jgi:hypothetical protein